MNLLSAATVGLVFGGCVGLVVGLLFGLSRRLRELRKRSGKKTVFAFMLIAAIAGAVMFFPFSEGLAMALYLASEGALAGGLIGASLATIPRLLEKSKGFGNSAGSTRTRYGYTGRERDPDTGLMYYRARWYDPRIGRFISEDSHRLISSITNPTKFTT